MVLQFVHCCLLLYSIVLW